MRALTSIACGVCLLTLLASAAFTLTIRVAPSTLVLSSGGGRLTVHTNVKYADAEEVDLEIDGTEIEVRTFADDRGFLVAQCSKEAATEAIGEFEGNFATAFVLLTVDGASAGEIIRVRK